MLLAKVSMDIEAKHNSNNIAKWTYNDITTKMWEITPLSKMWGIGKQMEKNLNNIGIFSIGDLAKYNPLELKEKFGIMGKELWNHANGIDLSVIKDYKKQTKSESFSHSQVLFKDYNENNIQLIISEMVDLLAARLRKNHKQTSCISLGIGYSKDFIHGFEHSMKTEQPTDSATEILKYCLIIFSRFYEYYPIRKVTISCGMISKKESIQLNLFENEKIYNNEININTTIDEIKNKFGKNSLLKASSLLDDSTAIERNKKIGGHYL